MVAIAAVVASKPASSFMYFTKPVPRWLRKNPVGNFARALALGAEVINCCCRLISSSLCCLFLMLPSFLLDMIHHADLAYPLR